jgi:hypothetical protein
MTKTFEFTVYEKVAGTTCVFAPAVVIKTGETFAEALTRLNESHPSHNVAEHLRGLWKEVPNA